MTDRPLIYNLLPQLYRRADGEDGPLRALAELLDEARATVERDIEGLYRNWFVETCEPAMLPYLAALVGGTDLPSDAQNPRALVADSVALARRKGTGPATGRILSDLSGWPVRVAAGKSGRVRIEVWQGPVHPLERVAPAPVAWLPGCYRFHPMGLDAPLHSVPRPFPGLDVPFDPRRDAPVALTRATPHAVLAETVEIRVEDESGGWRSIGPDELAVGDLESWDASLAEPAGGKRAVVDPELGRLMLIDRAWHDRRVAVSFGHAAPGPLGGGAYEREAHSQAPSAWLAYVHGGAAPGDAAEGRPPVFPTLADALEAWRSVPEAGVIRILDGACHEVEGLCIGSSVLVCPAEPNAPRSLAIEASSGEAPVLRGALRVEGNGLGLALRLSGLWVDGPLRIEGAVDLRLDHCTVHALSAMRQRREPVAAIEICGGPPSRQKLALDACLAGPLVLARGVALEVADSVVDGYDGGAAISGRPSASLARATLLGSSDFLDLDAVDTLFDRPFAVERVERGEVRFSLVPDGSSPFPVDRCVVGDEADDRAFVSVAFGQAGYARLARHSGRALRAGASNGSEIGAFNGERGHDREALLKAGLPDLLPIGLRYDIEWIG
jgi:hypothetical protein